MARFVPPFRLLFLVVLSWHLAIVPPVGANPLRPDADVRSDPASVHRGHRLAGRSRLFAQPDYSLPYAEWEYPRGTSLRRGGLFAFGDVEPSPEMRRLITVIRDRAECIARFGLRYQFGGEHPDEGGLDCSGAMQFLLADLGFDDMPRTSYHQYRWLREHRTVRRTKSIPEKMGGRRGILPGDLIFWGGTYDSGHKVSHVMIYLGQGGDGTHYMFGARGKKKRGLFGNGVDIFELGSGRQENLIGYGSLPGVS